MAWYCTSDGNLLNLDGVSIVKNPAANDSVISFGIPNSSEPIADATFRSSDTRDKAIKRFAEILDSGAKVVYYEELLEEQEQEPEEQEECAHKWTIKNKIQFCSLLWCEHCGSLAYASLDCVKIYNIHYPDKRS